MISYKEFQFYEKIKEKYSSKENIKYKKDGSLDMRYSFNRKLFGKEYKNFMILENRKYNKVYDSPDKNYREEILKMTENEICKLFS